MKTSKPIKRAPAYSGGFTETIPMDRAIFQSDPRMKVYKCPFCERSLFSQYIGLALPLIKCRGPMEPHVLMWSGGRR